MLNALGLNQFTPGAVGIWAILATVVGYIIRTWPIVKQRLNEARKIEVDADAEHRTTLLQRIQLLEEVQSSDRTEFFKAMGDERLRCDRELDEIRTRLRKSEDDNQGLMAMIRQFSQSTAMAVTNPDGVALTNAARKARGEGPK
jgi:uncharacterized protein YajQ (UPF0234 family)